MLYRVGPSLFTLENKKEYCQSWTRQEFTCLGAGLWSQSPSRGMAFCSCGILWGPLGGLRHWLYYPKKIQALCAKLIPRPPTGHARLPGNSGTLGGGLLFWQLLRSPDLTQSSLFKRRELGVGALLVERIQSIFSPQIPSYLLDHILKGFSSSAANGEEGSLAGEGNRAAICPRPSMAPGRLGRGRPKHFPGQWLCFPLASDQGQLGKEEHASKQSGWGQGLTGMRRPGTPAASAWASALPC